MSSLLFAGSILAITSPAAASLAADVAMFEPVELAEDFSITTYGIVRDTRCYDPEFCFREERLVVAAVVTHRGQRQEFALELGEPVRVAGGWLSLSSSATRPRRNGATPLGEYSLDYSFFR